jgi:hypothetical protein
MPKIGTGELVGSCVPATRVLATLCAELNATATLFPGTSLVLRYEVNEVRKQ